MPSQEWFQNCWTEFNVEILRVINMINSSAGNLEKLVTGMNPFFVTFPLRVNLIVGSLLPLQSAVECSS